MRIRAVAGALHMATAGFWLASIVFVGIAAAMAFPMMKDLAPTLPDFVGYPDDHWIIAGGYVTNPLFGVLRVVQITCVTICGITLLMTIREHRGKWLSLSRVILLIAALGLVIFDIAILGPRMQGQLSAFRDAARAGNVEAADVHRAAFDADHPVGRRVIEGTALCALGLVITGVAAVGRPRQERGA